MDPKWRVADPEAPGRRRELLGYDRATVVLLAFLVGAALALGGAAFAVVRGLGLWRQTKRTGGAFVRELASFEERTARTQRHLAEWERSNESLQVALERLRASQARLQVLRNGLAQAQARVRWLRVFLPR